MLCKHLLANEQTGGKQGPRFSMPVIILTSPCILMKGWDYAIGMQAVLVKHGSCLHVNTVQQHHLYIACAHSRLA